MIESPSETLSPVDTRIFSTVPASGEGTSIVALSDSSVTSGSSTETSSPSETRISITGTPSKSPMSGTLTVAISPASSYAGRIRRVGVDLVLLDRLGDRGGLDLALVGERLQGGDGDVVAVDLEVAAQSPAEVAAAVPVGAEHLVAAGNPGADPVGKRLHVVGGGDDRALRGAEAL